jgi:hypothetical protein
MSPTIREVLNPATNEYRALTLDESHVGELRALRRAERERERPMAGAAVRTGDLEDEEPGADRAVDPHNRNDDGAAVLIPNSQLCCVRIEECAAECDRAAGVPGETRVQAAASPRAAGEATRPAERTRKRFAEAASLCRRDEQRPVAVPMDHGNATRTGGQDDLRSGQVVASDRCESRPGPERRTSEVDVDPVRASRGRGPSDEHHSKDTKRGDQRADTHGCEALQNGVRTAFEECQAPRKPRTASPGPVFLTVPRTRPSYNRAPDYGSGMWRRISVVLVALLVLPLTPVSGSAKVGDGLTSALAFVHARCPGRYREISKTMWVQGARFNALYGNCRAGDGHDQHIWFFVGNRFVGMDASHSSPQILGLWRSADTLAFMYVLYKPRDANCCATGGGKIVRFRWTGRRLDPLDTVPARR